jgi:hypothetical protein
MVWKIPVTPNNIVGSERACPPGTRRDPIDMQWIARDAQADSVNSARSVVYRSKRRIVERYAGVT